MRGWAPMKMKSERAGWRVVSPVSELWTSIASRWSPPWASATFERLQTSMFEVAPI